MLGFTRIPNQFIDDLKLNPYQFQILSIIVRKTDGWCKLEDGISLSQFEKLVTFKKPKIIQTLKELVEMDLIAKKKQILDNNSNSFNIYKISDRVVTENNKGSNQELLGVVTENNKGSNQELLGVVTEDYTQNKTITKETKQNNYDIFLDFLKAKCKYKSKVTKTKEGKSLFNQIKDKKQLIIDYLKHQEEKQDYAVRVTKFMEDYNTVYKDKTNSNNNDEWSDGVTRCDPNEYR